MAWDLDAVQVRAGSKLLLGGGAPISLSLRQGELVALAGPNGAGKSTLLSVLAGDRPPSAGRAAFLGLPLSTWRPLPLAARLAVVRQRVGLDFPLTALEVALLGRTPHRAGDPRPCDVDAAFDALCRVDARALAARPYRTLSGGEQQRVQVARALAQVGAPYVAPDAPPAALLMDEPTASLDWRRAQSLLALARDLTRAAGLCVVVAIHDLNLAARYADRLLLLRDGVLTCDAPTAEALNPQTLEATFDLPMHLVPHPSGGAPVVVPADVVADAASLTPSP
jgi:iron complex transport system ATP-binding protein